MPGLEQTFCAIVKLSVAFDSATADFVDALPESILNAATQGFAAPSVPKASAATFSDTFSRSSSSILENTQRPVSDTTLQLNQLLAFNQMLDPDEPDGRGFFDPNGLLELWRNVTMQPGGVARISAQNLHAEMTLSEWCEFVCLLALKPNGDSPRGTRQRGASATIQRFILRELFPLVSAALAISTEKLSETAAQRRKQDSKAQRVALSGMFGSEASVSISAAIQVAGLPRRLSTEREQTEEERLAATRERLAANSSARSHNREPQQGTPFA
jgi:hypothetical protein